jgi:hypothetical protein
MAFWWYNFFAANQHPAVRIAVTISCVRTLTREMRASRSITFPNVEMKTCSQAVA